MLPDTPVSGKFASSPKARLQALRRIFGPLGDVLEAHCFLCGAHARGYLCKACFHDLPWNDHACRRCARALPDLPGELCGACTRNTPAFERAQAAFAYAWPVNRLIQRFKFHGDLAMGRILALTLKDYLDMHQIASPDLVVPVPLHRRRLATRGFNQATEIARIIAPALHVEVAADGLVRTQHTPAQSGLERAARRRNLRHAFLCRRPVRGLHVAVVDDVITTASTAEAIARTLKQAGAERVSVYALARA
jgi:ComF family protein